MGHLKRRISYDVHSRRLGLPGSFLAQHGLGAGGTVVVIAPTPTIRLITVPAQWSLYELLQSWTGPGGPRSEPLPAPVCPLRSESIVVGSGGRVVLPSVLALQGPGPRLELAWELVLGVLKLVLPSQEERVGSEMASLSLEQDLHLPESVSGQRPAPPLLPVPDGLVLPGPVVQVPLGKLHGVDPDYDISEYDRTLAEEIIQQGFLRPFVLMGPPPYRVLDGRKRLQVARGLRFPSIPALVFGPLTREDQAQLRYLVETTSDRWNMARQLRVIAQLHLNGADLKALAALLRKTPRTIQRYLRIAQDRRLIEAIEQGTLSLLEAERTLSPGRAPDPGRAERPGQPDPDPSAPTLKGSIQSAEEVIG